MSDEPEQVPADGDSDSPELAAAKQAAYELKKKAWDAEIPDEAAPPTDE